MESRQSIWTIHYVGLDKNPDDVVQTVHFIKKGDKFVPTTNFKDITSPKVEGYDVDIKTAHQDTILGENNTNGNFETTVIYTKPNDTIETPATESTSQTWTIKYIGLPSELTPKNKVQTIHFIKKGGKFVAVDSYQDVKSPEVDGYNVDTKVAKAKDAKVLKDGNLESIVIYTKPNKYVDTPPLTDNKIPNNHIPETHIPDEPTPDIPNPEKPKKQVPQKPTPSNPTPDPDPTPEVPVPDEDAPVKSGNLTSDSFVSARTNPTKVVPKKYRNTEKLLPQTGKKNSVALSMLGLATLSLTGLMGLAATKKKRRY